MKIAIPKERRPHEARVAASPETVKKMIALGAEVTVEAGAGTGAALPDAAFAAAGATIAPTVKDCLAGAEIVLKVQRPLAGGKGDELKHLAKGTTLICIADPFRAETDLAAYAKKDLTVFAMDFMPRITRAQSMDVLSSQANLAGYKAVLDGAANYGKAFPMMMTAAGTIHPAKVMVMGAGVAGLQAIATARRLGAIVSATDVRPAAKEQVESLGASFVAVEDEEFKQAETAGGYAKEMSDAYKAKQAALLAETLKKRDMVITTALIPGRPAPVLITEEMVAAMKPGSVIVDLAIDNGGNCALSKGGPSPLRSLRSLRSSARPRPGSPPRGPRPRTRHQSGRRAHSRCAPSDPPRCPRRSTGRACSRAGAGSPRGGRWRSRTGRRERVAGSRSARQA